MNYFYKRHLWLVPLCIVAFWGIWATQLVNAQSALVDLTASPTSLPATPGGKVTVTITYTVTGPAQLFYYPPADFEVINDDGTVLNSELEWNIDAPGTQEVTLRIKGDATPGDKPHRAVLLDASVERVLTLTDPGSVALSTATANPNLQITYAKVARETVEPGQPFTVTVNFQNFGGGAADDVQVDLTSESTVFTGLQLFPVGAIEAGQPITGNYSISTRADTADGSYVLTVKLLNGESEYDNQPVTITVEQPLQEPSLPPPNSTPVKSPQSTSVIPAIQVSEETTPIIDESVAPIALETRETGEATRIPEANREGGGNKTIQWILVGMIIVAVLLFVAIGIYLLSHARQQAKPAKVLPISVPKGQPSLKSSNGRSFPITSFPFTIGRGEGNNLIIDETFPQWESMSRHHARIVQHQQGYVIEDMGSQNKLRVQGRLTDRNLLRNGWQILIGAVEFTFYDGSVTPGGSA